MNDLTPCHNLFGISALAPYNFLIMSTSSPNLPENSSFPFVGWLREVAPYIHAFREKTFVIAFAGELALDFDQLENLIEDIAMLHAMGMRIVLVHGIRPQIDEQLSLRKIKSKFGKGNMSSYCLLYTSPSPRDRTRSRMPSSA